MKSLFSLSLVAIIISLSSFTSISDNKNTTFEKFGTYLGGGTIETSPIQLQLNSDHTYSYMDITNSDKQVQLSGKWEQDGKQIKLTGHEDIKFHSTWKIDSECACLKSKKGITFYRLCQ